MRLMGLLVVVALMVPTSDAGAMTPQQCIAATENFIEAMKRDPAWQGHIRKKGQLPLMRRQAQTRCARTLQAEDIRKLQCLASSGKMPEIMACIKARKPIVTPAAPAPEPPASMALPQGVPISSEACHQVHAHVFQVLLSDPKSSQGERAALRAIRDSEGAAIEKEACTEITPDGAVLLRCLSAITTVPEMEACVAQAKKVEQHKAGSSGQDQ